MGSAINPIFQAGTIQDRKQKDRFNCAGQESNCVGQEASIGVAKSQLRRLGINCASQESIN